MGIAVASYHRDYSGTWFLLMFLLAVPVRIFLEVVIRPRLERGAPQPRITYLAAWLGVTLSIFLVGFLGYGWSYLILGANKQEFAELFDTLSVPLGWFLPGFVVQPQRSFLDVIGIILANSSVIGVPVYGSYKIVRSAFNRNRVTQIRITDTNSTVDED